MVKYDRKGSPLVKYATREIQLRACTCVCHGGRVFPLPLKVLQAGLIIKLTENRLTRENQFNYTCMGTPKRSAFPAVMLLMCHPELRGGGRSVGLQRGRIHFTGSWKEQRFGKQMLVLPGGDNGTQRGLWSPSPPAPLSPRHLTHVLCTYRRCELSSGYRSSF